MSKPTTDTSIPTATTSTDKITPPLFPCPVITVSSSSSTSSKTKQCLALISSDGKQKPSLVALSSSHPSAASRTIAIAEIVKRQFANLPRNEGDGNKKSNSRLYQYTQLSSTLIDWPPPKPLKKKKEQATSTQPDKKRKSDDGIIDLTNEHDTSKRRKLDDTASRTDKGSGEPMPPASPVGDRTFHEDDENMKEDNSDDDAMAELSKPINLDDLDSQDVEGDLDDEDEDIIDMIDDDDDDGQDDDPMAELSKPIDLADLESSHENEDNDDDDGANDSDGEVSGSIRNTKDMSIDPSTPISQPSANANTTHDSTTTAAAAAGTTKNANKSKYIGIPLLEEIILDNPKRRKREKKENVTIGQERQKVRALPVLTIYLSTLKNAKLANLYGEQIDINVTKGKGK